MSTPGKILGLIALGGVLVFGLAWAGIAFVSDDRLNQRVVVPTESIAIPTDITAIRRGQHLASAVAACAECHASNMAGKVVVDDRLLARVVAPNLTRGRGGFGAAFGDADLVRAIRHGVDPNGHLLLIMPSDNYNHLSDADVGAMVAYLRSLPAIDSNLPTTTLRPLGRALFVIGELPLQPAAAIDPAALRPTPPPPSGVNPGYGQYLADIAGCATCHGPGYAGGAIPQSPPKAVPAANITPGGIGAWSEADFVRVMRTGIRPDGRSLAAAMPWPYYAQMTDDELRALWRFLSALPPRPTAAH